MYIVHVFLSVGVCWFCNSMSCMPPSANRLTTLLFLFLLLVCSLRLEKLTAREGPLSNSGEEALLLNRVVDSTTSPLQLSNVTAANTHTMHTPFSLVSPRPSPRLDWNRPDWTGITPTGLEHDDTGEWISTRPCCSRCSCNKGEVAWEGEGDGGAEAWEGAWEACRSTSDDERQ